MCVCCKRSLQLSGKATKRYGEGESYLSFRKHLNQDHKTPDGLMCICKMILSNLAPAAMVHSEGSATSSTAVASAQGRGSIQENIRRLHLVVQHIDVNLQSVEDSIVTCMLCKEFRAKDGGYGAALETRCTSNVEGKVH